MLSPETEPAHTPSQSRLRLILILGLLSALGPFSIDMYLPGFPAIAHSLHTTVDVVSYTLSSYFIGICIGQLVCGPLLDRFGRKAPLYVGMVLYILAAVGCAMATSIEVLIAFRFLQALGGCLGLVAPRAIVRDLFPVSEIAKVFSLLLLVIAVSPILAPTIGSYVVAQLGWHAIFIILAIVAALMLAAVVFLLPESRPPNPEFSLRPSAILGSYLAVSREPQFYTYALAGAVPYAGLYAYISGSPFVFINLFGVSGQHYGWIFAFIALGLITCSQLNSLLLRRYASEHIIPVVLAVQVMVGLIMVIGTYFHWLGLAGTIACILCYLSCQGFSFPNASALSLAPFTREAGSASALMGAVQMGLGAIASALVGLLSNGTALPMVGVMASCSLIGWVVLLIGRRSIRPACRAQDLKEQTIELIEKY